MDARRPEPKAMFVFVHISAVFGLRTNIQKLQSGKSALAIKLKMVNHAQIDK